MPRDDQRNEEVEQNHGKRLFLSQQKYVNHTSVIYHSFFNVTNTNFCTCDEIA